VRGVPSTFPCAKISKFQIGSTETKPGNPGAKWARVGDRLYVYYYYDVFKPMLTIVSPDGTETLINIGHA
jgi:hypothetical protein